MRGSRMAWFGVVAAFAAAWIGAARATPPAEAPEFVGIRAWINSPPLSMRALRGKVVLIDFWAYSCINCLRNTPHVKRWHDTYKDAGLVVIGVHTPEFDFEKDRANVEAAIARLGIDYPVALDDRMRTWNAWSNRYWPAEYLVDRSGRVIHHHYGEGRYAETEAAIRTALGLEGAAPPAAEPDFSRIGSPEMYFGLARARNFINIEVPPQLSHRYTRPSEVPLNRYALEGTWRIRADYAELTGDTGAIELRFRAGKLHMVAEAAATARLEVILDGRALAPVDVDQSRLYTLVDGEDYREHHVLIRVHGKGFRAYTFTFG